MRCVVWVGFLVGAFFDLSSSSNAQFRQRFFMPPVETQVTPEIDRGVQQALDDAKQLLDQKQFIPAVTRLQSVLDYSEDYFLEKDFRTKSLPHTSIRTQTRQILADLPPEGRTAYESQIGSRARDLLKQALAANDFDTMSLVASRYQMTAAGFDALQVLAARAFDHEQPLEAALLCESSLAHPRANGPLRVPLLLQQAFAWHLAGQTERSRAALKSLNAEKGPWRIGGRGIDPIPNIADAPDWLNAQFGPSISPRTEVVTAWSLPRGGLTGNESATAACPVGGGLWTISPRKHLRFISDSAANQTRIQAFDELTHQIERTMRDNHRLSQPASVPLVIGDVVVYRTLNDVTAVSLKDGHLLWRSSTTDGMLAYLFQSPLATNEGVASSSLLTFRGYLRFKLFRDQLSGSLTSDGKYVYAIEESDAQFSPLLPRSRMPFGAQLIMDPANKLVAYDLAGGRLAWEVGGQTGTPPTDLSGFFFLGPPLPSEGRLYCLAESKSEIRLVSLIPEDQSARLEWSQALATTDRGFFVAPRRLAGLVPVITDGIAVCPTANGSVVAFDLIQQQLRWGYSYESLTRRNQQGGTDFLSDEEEGRWLDNGPVLTKGHVIVTPRDSAELHCLNLVDGAVIWKRPREHGLYVAAVVDDRVVVIGQTHVSAYSLEDGTEVWKEQIEIPEPSGRGVRIGAQYLLPLSTGEIATLDLATGRILGRSKLSEGRIPGNLAVGAGALVSCGINDVVGFRPLAEIEQQVVRQLAANPLDPEALALRGELKLHRGQEDEAVEDLRQSIRQRPTAQVKRILAETLLNRLRDDPRGLLKSAVELESLAEEPRQQIEFRRFYAKALSESGDRVGAVKQLVRMALITSVPYEMIAVSPGHLISLEQSIRSQLFTLYEEADMAQRKAISAELDRAVEAVLLMPDRTERISRFVKLTAGHPAADQPLLRLVEPKNLLPDELSRIRLLERLTRSEARSIAATAVASLAAKFLEVHAIHQALPWIQELKSYPQEICRDGKTGRQLSEEWLSRADLRTAKPASVWPVGTIDVKRSEDVTTVATFPVDVVTRTGHDFEGWSFETDSQVTMLTARDPKLRVVWRLPLLGSSDESRGQPSQIHIRGRRLAFSSGMWLCVMEAMNSQEPPRVLFDQSLRPSSLTIARSMEPTLERRLLPNGRRFQLISDARGTAGFLVGLSDEVLCYQLDNRLFAADPETGRVLWSWTGPPFAKADATVDKFLVINTPTNPANGALLLRTRDGSLLERHQGSPHDMPLWFRGTRRLSQRNVDPDQRLFEMRDYEGDHVIWQSQHPAGSVPSLIEDDELAILEPNGNLLILNLATGEHRLTVELPAKRPQKGAGNLAVQRTEDRYLVVAGVSPKNTELRRISPLNIGSPRDFGPAQIMGSPSIAAFTLDGFVCSIRRKEATLEWAVPVNDLAFDTAQSSHLPVLVLAAWQSDMDRISGFPLSPRLSVLVLDKRTGRKVYEKQEAMTPIGRGVQFNPMIDDRKLVIDFYNWQLNLTFLAPK